MSDHHETAKQAIKENWGDFFKRKSYKVTHRLKNVNELTSLNYDLFILDRDCTLQEYHGKRRVLEFEETLKAIDLKSELVSNSSYEELLKIRDLYGDLMPISKLVKFNGFNNPHLIRFVDGKLTILSYNDILGRVNDVTTLMSQEDKLFGGIRYNSKKPNPQIIKSVIATNIYTGRINENANILMVGDRYFTDIVAGNLAGIYAARVKPYKPLSDKPDLIAMRIIDSLVGNIASRL